MVNGLTHFAKTPFEEMVGAVDDDQFLRLGRAALQLFEQGTLRELIAAAADEQLRFRAPAKEIEIVGTLVNRSHRNPQPNQPPDSIVRTSRFEAHSGAEREPGKDQGKVKFLSEPIEGGAHIIDFSAAAVVLPLAESGPAKVEAQYGEPE